MQFKHSFLFGAGASYACKGVNIVPPLGKDLFHALAQAFPKTWGALPYWLGEKLTQNFEEGMEIIWEKYSTNIPPLMKDIAEFFSKIAITKPEENLYCKILALIKEKGILGKTIFSTLNYECLLEIAASKSGITVNYFEKPDKSYATVFKLHGSCNFISNNISTFGNISYTAGVSFITGVKAIQLNEVVSYCSGDNAIYPSMCIYMKNKPLQVAPNVIENIQKCWQETVENTENMFIVGVYPNPDDKHIWDSISEAKCKVHFCGNDKGFKIWQEKTQRKDNYLGSNFEDIISDILKLL